MRQVNKLASILQVEVCKQGRDVVLAAVSNKHAIG